MTEVLDQSAPACCSATIYAAVQSCRTLWSGSVVIKDACEAKRSLVGSSVWRGGLVATGAARGEGAEQTRRSAGGGGCAGTNRGRGCGVAPGAGRGKSVQRGERGVVVRAPGDSTKGRRALSAATAPKQHNRMACCPL